jgi:hypothetical protein
MLLTNEAPKVGRVRSPEREEIDQVRAWDRHLSLRLAAASRVGELPDYMLEFVDSLRARAKRTTS